MRNFIKLFIVIILLSSYLNSYSQDTIKTTIAIVPQSLIFKGMRFDFEKNIPRTRSWILVAPQFYFQEKEAAKAELYDKNSYDKLIGFGADLYLKYYISGYKDFPTGGYFALGINYHHFKINHRSYQWFTYTENNLEYLEYKLLSVTDNIDQYGGNFIIGYNFTVTRNFFFDAYIGYGFKNSLIKEDEGLKTNKFKEQMWDYGYSGLAVALGMRIGIMF